MNRAVDSKNIRRSPLIPRKLLFGDRDVLSPKLSPDGKYLAYLAPDRRDTLQIWLYSLERATSRQVTQLEKCYIEDFYWTYSSKQLVYLQDFEGDENFHLYSVNIESARVKDLTPFANVQAEVIALEAKFPDEILVGLNKDNPQLFDVYRLNLHDGTTELDTKNPGNIVSWQASTKLEILAAIATSPNGGSDLLYRQQKDRPWQKLLHWDAEDDAEIYGFSGDDKRLYLIAFDDVNTRCLTEFNLSTQQKTIIAIDEQYDLESVVSHPTTKKIQAIAFYREKLHWQILDRDIALDFAALESVRPGQVYLIERDLADKTWLVAYSCADAPTYFYIYHRDTKSTELLFCARSQLEQQPLVAVEAISYRARDGLTIHGYLALPQQIDPPFATVMLVHGGPWFRDTWRFDPLVQWLTNRGYAVLQPNFRGSAGYGKSFLNQGDRQWGGAMNDDLIDGVNWLVRSGIAQKDRVGIMGVSYGGYAVLAALTFTPEVFACGINVVGISNLISHLENLPDYWIPHLEIFKKRIGDLDTQREFLKSRSPLFSIDKIQKPLLIAHGANDPRVKKSESEQIVNAVRQAGKSVEYVLYTDEGHGFARSENLLHFSGLAEQFLAQHLGGRFEPLEDIKGHSGVIK